MQEAYWKRFQVRVKMAMGLFSSALRWVPIAIVLTSGATGARSRRVFAGLVSIADRDLRSPKYGQGGDLARALRARAVDPPTVTGGMRAWPSARCASGRPGREAAGATHGGKPKTHRKYLPLPNCSFERLKLSEFLCIKIWYVNAEPCSPIKADQCRKKYHRRNQRSP